MPKNNFKKQLSENLWQFLQRCMTYLITPNYQAIADDTNFYTVTAEDADLTQEDVCDMAFFVSLIKRAAQTKNFKTDAEIKQFLLDFPRTKVLDDGKNIAKEDPTKVLMRWSKEIAKQTRLPEEKVTAIIATLNQGAGYGAVSSLLKHGASNGQTHLRFSVMHHSRQSTSLLERKGNTLTYFRSIPMIARPVTNDADLEEPDANAPDVIVTTKVTINLAYFTLDNQDNRSINIVPAGITQTSAIERNNKALLFGTPTLQKYCIRETQGFQVVPDADLLSELGWVHVTACSP